MPCPADKDAARAAAEIIAAACGVTLQPYQLEFLERISKRDIADPFAFMPTGSGKSVVMRELQRAGRIAGRRCSPPVIVDDIARRVSVIPQRDAWEMPARPAFDWRASQRSQHKRRP